MAPRQAQRPRLSHPHPKRLRFPSLRHGAASAPAASNVAPPSKSLAQAEQRVRRPRHKAVNADGQRRGRREARRDGGKPAPAAAATVATARLRHDARRRRRSPPDAPRRRRRRPAKGEGFVVQLAAFADDKGANALANKLKKAGYAAAIRRAGAHEPRHAVARARRRLFGTRAEADAARAKLKADGYNGIVATAK